MMRKLARHLLRRARRLRQPIDDALPFGMLDLSRSREELAAAHKVARLYHKGQTQAWDGRRVLSELIKKHGGIHTEPDKAEAIRHIFAVILWGELAAWKISAALAVRLEPMDAKMAATSQAHDEARHFYVMHDYLKELGEVPRTLRPRTKEMLERVLEADSTAKMLLGMQLVVEPMALTLFHLVRDRHIEPVLEDLLTYFEQDEARHVALGVLHLPEILRRMSLVETADLAQWQLREYLLQLDMLQELGNDFRALGIDPTEALQLGRKKQVQATRLLADRLGRGIPVMEALLRVVDFRAAWTFSGDDVGLSARARNSVRAALDGFDGDHRVLEREGWLEGALPTAPARAPLREEPAR